MANCMCSVPQEQVANCIVNVLKAHAAAVKVFRKVVPGGMIAMNLNAESSLPFDASSEMDKVGQLSQDAAHNELCFGV